MPSSPRTRRPQRRRLIAGAVAASALPLGIGGAGPALASAVPSASATGSGAASSGPAAVAAQEALAARLAAQIQADGVQLDQLSAAYDAATIHDQQVTAEVTGLGRRLAGTDRSLVATRRLLREQALAAYMTGDQPLLEFASGTAGRDPSLTKAYAEIAADREQDALASYRTLLAAQTEQAQALRTERLAAAAAVAQLATAEAQARAAADEEQATLAQVRGRVAVLVADDQRQAAAREAAAVQAALRDEGQRLPASTGPSPSTDSRSAPSPSAPSPAVAPTSSAPTTAPGTAAPTSSAPTTPAPGPVATPPPTPPAPTPPPTTSPATTPAAAPPTTTPTTTAPTGGPAPQAPGVAAVLAYARAQLGKPYQWGGAGPDSFDCSGLVMMAWEQAGVHFPHLAQDQYDLTERIPLADLLPGDLVFFGTPDDVYHVGIYVGGGDMLDAPSTGNVVRIESMYWSDLLGGGRVTG